MVSGGVTVEGIKAGATHRIPNVGQRFAADPDPLPLTGSCHKRQKPQAPTPQALIRNRQTRKVANVKGLNRNTNLT